MAKRDIIIVGCGDRGLNYVKQALKCQEKVDIVAIAEPDVYLRQRVVKLFKFPEKVTFFNDFREILAKPKFADGVVIAAQTGSAVEFAKAGYHILIDSPAVSSVEECHQLIDAVKSCKVTLTLGNTLRNSEIYRKLKAVIDEGAVGEVVSINHTHCIGYWHFAHHIRGNWQNGNDHKCWLQSMNANDMDLILFLMKETTPTKISSFGSADHFSKTEKPPEAGEAKTCFECDYEDNCPFSAKRNYLGALRKGHTGWPVSTITSEIGYENIKTELKSSRFGQCVYECGNDVCDNQVVSMGFDDGKTAIFTMTAFSENCNTRKTRIFGTKGEVVFNGHEITVYEFRGGKFTQISYYYSTTAPIEDFKIPADRDSDFNAIEQLAATITSETDSSDVLNGHLLSFAAESSRLSENVIDTLSFLKIDRQNNTYN